MAAVAQWLLPKQRPPHGRADPVGADDHVADHRVSSVEEYLPVLGRAVAGRPETQALGRRHVVGPPHPGPARGDTVAEPERAQCGDRVRRDDAAESHFLE
jgi:hypothetical protein